MFRTVCAANLVIAPGGPEALTFGRLWYTKPDNAIGYAMHSSRSQDRAGAALG